MDFSKKKSKMLVLSCGVDSNYIFKINNVKDSPKLTLFLENVCSHFNEVISAKHLPFLVIFEKRQFITTAIHS